MLCVTHTYTHTHTHTHVGHRQQCCVLHNKKTRGRLQDHVHNKRLLVVVLSLILCSDGDLLLLQNEEQGLRTVQTHTHTRVGHRQQGCVLYTHTWVTGNSVVCYTTKNHARRHARMTQKGAHAHVQRTAMAAAMIML